MPLDERPNSYLVADKNVLDFLEKAQNFALLVNQKTVEVHKGISHHPLAGGAFLSITADAFALHRCVYSLCADGWAFATPILLRSILELLLSATVIANTEDESDYMGFKYSHWFLKGEINDSSISPASKRKNKAQIDEALNKLDVKIQNKACDFIFKEKMRAFWYCPEYNNPTDVLEKHGSSNDIKYLYKLLSSAAHGGFLGLRLLKDKPDDIHPNPRSDKWSQNMALLMSSRLLLELFRICGDFEKCETDNVYWNLISEFIKLRPILESI